ncbi:hypothetical protein MMPV_001386, partial [Pyropia vietnamensis]
MTPSGAPQLDPEFLEVLSRTVRAEVEASISRGRSHEEPDYDIPEHRVGDALLDKVTSWKSYRLRDKDPTYTARMARRMARLSQNMSHSFGGFPRFTGKKPFLVFAFLRRFVKAANDNDVSEGRALYLLGNFLAGEAEIRFSKVMPDSAGHIPGRTVSSYPEAVHWLLTNYAEPQALNQAVAECTRATMAASETPEGFAQLVTYASGKFRQYQALNKT